MAGLISDYLKTIFGSGNRTSGIPEFGKGGGHTGKVHNCSQCGKEPATGTRKMSDGTWKRVGPKCKSAMGEPRVNLIKKKEEAAARKRKRDADKS